MPPSCSAPVVPSRYWWWNVLVLVPMWNIDVEPSALVRRCDDVNVVPGGRLTVIWSRVTRRNSVASDPAGRFPLRGPGVVDVSSVAGTFHEVAYWASGQSSPSHGISHHQF